jgi:pimeloyl-[acyl-carrier protein] methyl ester esterase
MLCVLVHGWGMNRAIWQPLIETLPVEIEILALDLPGHGLSAADSFQSLQDLADTLRRQINRPAIWIGWSLGGLAVMQYALEYPQHVRGMMLVSSTPCFVARNDWPSGMESAVFDGFEKGLQEDYAGTLKRFLSLQVKDSPAGRGLLKRLRENVLQQPAANPQALSAGLEILKTTDLRARMPDLHMPLALALGGRDGLVNKNTGEFVQRVLPHADVKIYDDAAHAPFLSHLPEFSAQLLQLIKTVHDHKS